MTCETRTSPASAIAFLYLAVDQTWLYLPPAHFAPPTTCCEPLTKVSRQRIKVEIKPVTGKERQTARCQVLSECVDEDMCHVLRAGAELKHRQNLGARIDGQPQPEHLGGTAQSGAQFVQLQVREVEIAEAALMEDLSVPACASEPGGDRRLTIAEDAFSLGSVQPFGECEICTMATCWEGVFRWYNGVSRRVLNVVWQA